MIFSRAEKGAVVEPDPQILGVEVDPEAAQLYDEYAEGKDFEAIYKLWTDPEVTNPTIRQRALTALTAPSGNNLPFPTYSVSRFLRDETDLAKESRTVWEELKVRPDLVGEVRQAFDYWLNSKKLDSRTYSSDAYAYQRGILKLIPLVDEETADSLYSHFSLKDLTVYSGLEDSSGYYPAFSLISEKDIPDKYKQQTIDKLFDIARSEQVGIMTPRAEHEKATRQLAQGVTIEATSEEVDVSLINQVVNFLEETLPPKSTYIANYRVTDIAKHLEDKTVKFDFLWRHISVGTRGLFNRFQISNDEDLEMVEWLDETARSRGVVSFSRKAEELKADYENKRRALASQKAAELAIYDKIKSV